MTIIQGLKREYISYVTSIQGWVAKPSLVEFEPKGDVEWGNCFMERTTTVDALTSINFEMIGSLIRVTDIILPVMSLNSQACDTTKAMMLLIWWIILFTPLRKKKLSLSKKMEMITSHSIVCFKYSV